MALAEARKRRLMYVDIGTGTVASPNTIGTNTASTFASLVDFCNSITQGSGQAARVSDTVFLESIDIKMVVYYNFSGSAFSQDFVQAVRYTLFHWLPNTALVLPTPGSIFQNVTSTGVLSSFDFELKNNYRVLHDKIISVSGFADSATGFAMPNQNSHHVIIFNKKLNNVRVDYTPTATTASNKLYLSLYSSSNTGPAPVYYLISRLYYYNDES